MKKIQKMQMFQVLQRVTLKQKPLYKILEKLWSLQQLNMQVNMIG